MFSALQWLPVMARQDSFPAGEEQEQEQEQEQEKEKEKELPGDIVTHQEHLLPPGGSRLHMEGRYQNPVCAIRLSAHVRLTGDQAGKRTI